MREVSVKLKKKSFFYLEKLCINDFLKKQIYKKAFFFLIDAFLIRKTLVKRNINFIPYYRYQKSIKLTKSYQILHFLKNKLIKMFI